MLKLLGAIFVSITVSLIGFLYCERLKNRVRYLESLKSFILNCGNKMRFCSYDIFTILNECDDKEIMFLKKINRVSITDSKKLNDIFSVVLSDESDIKALVGFISELGSSDIEGQKIHCDYYFDVFSKLHNEAKQKLNENGKLYRTLFIFGGLALFILIV